MANVGQTNIIVERSRMMCLLWFTSDKIQPQTDILRTYVNLATNVLGPEYISIYVKYCYLDTLILLIQTFIEWTSGMLIQCIE
jgi:hypothetical protein